MPLEKEFETFPPPEHCASGMFRHMHPKPESLISLHITPSLKKIRNHYLLSTMHSPSCELCGAVICGALPRRAVICGDVICGALISDAVICGAVICGAMISGAVICGAVISGAVLVL